MLQPSHKSYLKIGQTVTIVLSYKQGLGSDIFFSTDPDPAQLKKNPDPTWNRNEEKIYLYFR